MNSKKSFDDIETTMKGKTYQYANVIHYVLGVFIDYENEKCLIKTNVTSFDRPLSSIREFLKYWQPASNITTIGPEIQNQIQFDECIAGTDGFSNNLIQTLNDNITKLKNNKDYIPQAMAINKNINTLIQLAKIRLDFAKHFKPNYRK